MLAHATRSDDHAPVTARGAGQDHPAAGGGGVALSFIRYLDVVLVVASTPLVLLTSAPKLGFAIGAIGWILLRFSADLVKSRAWRARDARSRAALQLAAILGRVWLIALLVLGAHFLGHNADGIAAAVVVLVAFTVELATSMAFRREIVAASRRAS
jgi:hypothetical protein